MKKLVLGLVAVVVLLIGGLLVLPNFIDWDKYKEQGLSQVKAMSGYDVAIAGDLSFGFLPFPHVSASDVSITNPSVSSDPLAEFDALSVSVALAPLLHGAVQVSEVRLSGPRVDLRVDKDGRGNWLSPEVEAMIATGGKDGSGETAAPSTGAGVQAVSFDRVIVEDGAFRFTDASKGSVSELTGIDLAVRAESLGGPFDVKGGFVFGGAPVEFSLESDAIDREAGSVLLKLEGEYAGHDVAYNGMLAFAQPYEAQGEFEVRSAALPGFADGVALRGTLSANEQTVVLKDAVGKAGGDDFTGQMSAGLKPLLLKADLKSDAIVDLDTILPKAGGASTSSSKGAGTGSAEPAAAMLGFLPQTLSLPMAVDADVRVSVGGVIYNKALIKDIGVTALKTGKVFSVQAQIGDLPGKGPAIVKGALSFADVSVSKAGGVVYSDPVLTGNVQANSQNVGYLVEALSGQTGVPVLRDSKIGKFSADVSAKTGRIAVSEAVVNLDDLKMSLSGALANGTGKRPLLSVDAQIGALDLDSVLGGGNASSGKGSSGTSSAVSGNKAADPLAAIALPFDVKASLRANELVYNAQSFEDLKVSADVTDVKKVIGVEAFGATISVAGQSMDALKVSVKHPSLSKAAKDFGVALPSYGALSNPVDVSFGLGLGDGGAVSLKDIQGRILGSSVSGRLGYDGSGVKPYASGDLKFGSLVLKSVQGSNTGSSSSKKGSAGKWSSDTIDTAFLHALNADFNVVADSLLYETWDLKAPSLKVVLKDGALDVQDLKAAMFGGDIAMNAKLSSASKAAPLSLSTNASITDVDLESLVSALSGSTRFQASGKASLSLNVAGSGASQKAIVSTLGGDVTLSGQSFVMKGFDLAGIGGALLDSNKPVARIQQLVSGASSSGQTAFDTIDGAYTITNGVVNIDSMAMTGPEAIIVSTGSADIPAWYLDTSHTITLVNATGVAPFEVDIKGALDNPANTFGKGLFQSYYQQKLIEKVPDLLGEDVSEKLQKFGILPQGNSQATTTNDNSEGEDGAAVKSTEEQAKDALQSVIKGLF